MSGKDMRDFMKRLNETAVKEVGGRRGSLMKISEFQAQSIWEQSDVEVKRDMSLDLINNFRTDATGKFREREKVKAMQRPEQIDAWVSNMLLHGEDLSSARIREEIEEVEVIEEKVGLAIQINEMVMADLNNPYELTIQLEEAEEKENLVRVLADKDIEFSNEKLVDTNQSFYFDTEATLKQANEAIEAWGWKTNLTEKKKRKKKKGGKALSTMGGADSQGRHSNTIGGDYRKPKNTGVSANPGFFGEDVEGALPSFDEQGRSIKYKPKVGGLGQQLSDMYYIGDDDVEEDYIEDPNGDIDADYIEDLSPEDNEMEEGPSSLFHKMLKKTKKTRREI